MNKKLLAMLPITGLALSLAYTMPAMADDTANAANPAIQGAPSDNNTFQVANNTRDSSTNAAAAAQSDANTNVGNDEGTPDTATGDDDY